MPNLFTHREQQLWTERIHQEDKIDRKPTSFSLQYAIRSRGLPTKPNGVDAAFLNKKQGELLEPLSSDVRAALSARTSPPRHRFLWPDTTTQEVGWLMQKPEGGLPLAERSTMIGLSPRQGLGWSDSGGVQDRRGGGAAARPVEAAVPAPQSARAPRAAAGARPWRKLPIGEEEHPGDVVSPLGGGTGGGSQARHEVQLPPVTPRDPWMAGGAEAKAPTPPTVDVSASRTSASRTSAPGGEGTPARARLSARSRPTKGHDQAVALATERCRAFTRVDAAWRSPRGASDVSTFADTYQRSWGVSLFAANKK